MSEDAFNRLNSLGLPGPEPKVIYEPHPCSEERAATLRAKGYQVLDAKFAPEGYVYPDAEKQKKAKAD